MISIIDYGSGNVNAYAHIFKRLNIPHAIVKTSKELENTSKLILPGVGAFDKVMFSLNNSGLREPLDELVIEKKTPILGVCVGMQIMACQSEEGQSEGLGWIKGSIVSIDSKNLKHKPTTPHMGWNSIKTRNQTTIFSNVDLEQGFYFLHSYYLSCDNQENIIATVEYGDELTCAVNSNNIYGFQFHPEKSHLNGVNLLKNFARL